VFSSTLLSHHRAILLLRYPWHFSKLKIKHQDERVKFKKKRILLGRENTFIHENFRFRLTQNSTVLFFGSNGIRPMLSFTQRSQNLDTLILHYRRGFKPPITWFRKKNWCPLVYFSIFVVRFLWKAINHRIVIS
jgi:hypothetical protein